MRGLCNDIHTPCLQHIYLIFNLLDNIETYNWNKQLLFISCAKTLNTHRVESSVRDLIFLSLSCNISVILQISLLVLSLSFSNLSYRSDNFEYFSFNNRIVVTCSFNILVNCSYFLSASFFREVNAWSEMSLVLLEWNLKLASTYKWSYNHIIIYLKLNKNKTVFW